MDHKENILYFTNRFPELKYGIKSCENLNKK